jgi:hypothetical protein
VVCLGFSLLGVPVREADPTDSNDVAGVDEAPAPALRRPSMPRLRRHPAEAALAGESVAVAAPLEEATP